MLTQREKDRAFFIAERRGMAAQLADFKPDADDSCVETKAAVIVPPRT
jgi:hypothetical protein